MKKILIPILICVLLLSVSVQAQSAKIVDNAGLLTDQQSSALESRAQLLTDIYQMDVVILTVDSLNGRSAQAYADDFFDYNGYGFGDDHSGVLFLISMEHRDWAISTCADGICILSDYEIDSIVDTVLPYLSDGDYYSGFLTYLSKLEGCLYDYRQSNVLTPAKMLQRFFLALVIGAALAGIVLLIMRSRMNTARFQSGAGSYVRNNSFDLFRCHDLYLYSHTTKIRRDTNSGGGSTHRSSSGRSHGGQSGKF